nr:isochorismatase family protein [Catellatospora sichuanensis]
MHRPDTDTAALRERLEQLCATYQTARRVSAFAGSDLDLLLRAQWIEHLMLTGIATSGVVLSTLRQAADLDYRLTVLADGCHDSDPEVHAVLTTKVLPGPGRSLHDRALGRIARVG